MESVLWDDEDDLGDVNTTASSSAAGKGVKSDTTVSDGELERESESGDVGGLLSGKEQARSRIS